MLLQFYFSNYKSFEGETTLDLRASGSNELADHVRVTGNDKVLPVTAIYGANASGKSTVYSAFHDMSWFVVRSFYNAEENHKADELSFRGAFSNIRKPFKMSSSRSKPTEFDIYYITSVSGRDKYVNYGFVIDDEGVAEEWLKTNNKTGVRKGEEYNIVFSRKRNHKIKFNEDLENYRDNLEISLGSKVLLVSLGAQLKVKEMVEVRRWFLANEPIDYSRSISDSAFPWRVLPHFASDPSVKDQLLSFLRSFDDSIQDLVFEKQALPNDRVFYEIYLIHKDKDSGKASVKIPFDEESSGTIKMAVIFQDIQSVLKQGSVFFADELDIKLHPLLMRNIILTFADPKLNPKNAQLIFTTHNTIYMDMELLRRDEIWFTEKRDYVSELYSLSDFVEEDGTKVRKDTNYEKNYLLGRYGAVPALSVLLKEEGDE